MPLTDFHAHPGYWFVWATLLPLASFLFLLVVGGVRNFLRLYQDASGRPKPPPAWPAYVATAAIAGAFVLCLIGAVQFFADHQGHDGHDAHTAPAAAHAGDHADERKDADHKDDKAAAPDDHDHAGSAHADDGRWSASWTWLYTTTSRGLPGSRLIQLGYHIDHLSVVMFLMVTLIATLIHVFSIGYMAEEKQAIVEDHQVHTAGGYLHRRGRFGRFFMFLSLFCFSMLNLVLADNFFQIFLSWELVGICSYLLIGFYYERRSASTAANKAFITNRVGDAGFIIGLLIFWTYFGTFNFQDIFNRIRPPAEDAHGHAIALAGQVVRGQTAAWNEHGQADFSLDPKGSDVLLLPQDGHLHADDLKPTFKDGKTPTQVEVAQDPGKSGYGSLPYWILTLAGLGVFLGCVGKSAQFPLHVWLPDAMEGPTPVSALIHAATMVAAGVYLVGRAFPIFTPEARLVISYTGAITLFVAATIAIVMTDIKKVLAYSTVSQLGYMMLALGIGGWVAGLFHLLTHAFFKALLFLGSGSVIHGCHHEQEMTKMGGLYPRMKITALTMLVGVFAIAGIPLFSGWYSKDAVISIALGYAMKEGNRVHLLLFLLPLVTAGITTFYMFRMWFLTFTGEPRDHHVHEHAHESHWLMTVPLIVLAIFSVCVAWGWPVWDPEASALEHTIHHAMPLSVQADFGRIEGEVAVGPTAGSERFLAHEHGMFAGMAATAIVLVAIVFAMVTYWKPVQKLDPDEAKEQFQGLHTFLSKKWYFDELYSAALVRPALAAAHWARSFDGSVIDGFVNGLGRAGVVAARCYGWFDNHVIDGVANGLGRACYGLGSRFRSVQTGFLRSYVLFLVLAAVGIFVVLAYYVARVSFPG